MNIQELVTIASRGHKRNDDGDGPGCDEIMSVIEIEMKAKELNEEIRAYQRWDKETIARKTANIIWLNARLAGMYGINLEDELKKKIQESKSEPSAKLEKLANAPTLGRIKDVKTVYRSKGKLPRLPRISKPKG